MEGISDLRIVGIDSMRPPRIRKEPYINLYFKLSHKAPENWCDDYSRLVSKTKYSVKLDPVEGLFIETWVRRPDEIAAVVEMLKAAVTACNEGYIARIEAEQRAAAAGSGSVAADDSEQGQLNRIIAGLNFGD